VDEFVADSQDAIPPPESLDPADALSSIPERIGYLKEVCGIDFGWGSSTLMEWILEHIHIYGGFTWATSIVILAAMTRAILFYPMVQASDMSAKVRSAKPFMDPVREKMKAAYAVRDNAKMAEAKAELKELNKEYGVRMRKLFLPVLIQIPLQFGGFRTLRNMAELPVPALETENWLWAQDLTLSDPFCILPFVNAFITYLTIKVSVQPDSHDPNTPV
jgi:YidC/Oxa1 family membrane protein insertase